MTKNIKDFIIQKEMKYKTINNKTHTDSEFINNSPYNTGEKLELFYRKNKESLSKHKVEGIDFGTEIEPSGDYLNLEFNLPKNPIDGFEYGEIKFNKPLFLEFKSTNSKGWKKDLSEMFNNKTGANLNKAIKKAGYDAVITVEYYKGKYYLNESVNISAVKNIIDVSNNSEKRNKNKTKNRP